MKHRRPSSTARLGTLLVAWAVASAAAMGGERPAPLSELGSGNYRGESGGLYGNGRNEPPAAQRRLAQEAIASIQPLDAAGRASPGGKIVLLSIGMSNTTQEFSAFVQLAKTSGRMRPGLVLVDGARGGADAAVWAGSKRNAAQGGDPWRGVDARLRSAGATRAQVQASWIKHALAGPGGYGKFPAHTQALERALAKIITRARQEYPNLRIAFLSSRIYGGYASGALNPEPYAYESAFAVRDLIRRQVEGDEALNCDARRGAVRAPVLLWGPYLWADGRTARRSDGLSWLREDFREDGTHPSNQGRRKVALELLKFFTHDEFGKGVLLR